MPNQVLLDNWTLQEITYLTREGLSKSQSGKLVVDKNNDSHFFKSITHGGVQIDALFNFLQNLVLRDSIFLDPKFTFVWRESDFLNQLETDGIITVHDFQEEKFSEIRKAIVEQLCTTSSIREVQRLNEREWEENQRSHNGYMSQLIWGGAGMLARSYAYETYYLPHPLREYAFSESRIAKRDAYSETMSFISSNRTKLHFFDYGNTEAIRASFLLPPFIPTIIEESNNIDDLFRVALQMRDQYEDLRKWLKQFQKALDSEETKEISKHIKLLKSVQKNIENKYNPDKLGTLDLGFDIFSLSPNISFQLPVNKIRNRIGVRSTINNLILHKAGYSSVKKLINLLGESRSKLGIQVYEEIISNYSIKENNY